MSTAVIGNRTSRATLPPVTVPFGKRALDIALAGVGLVRFAAAGSQATATWHPDALRWV